MPGGDYTLLAVLIGIAMLLSLISAIYLVMVVGRAVSRPTHFAKWRQVNWGVVGGLALTSEPFAQAVMWLDHILTPDVGKLISLPESLFAPYLPFGFQWLARFVLGFSIFAFLSSLKRANAKKIASSLAEQPPMPKHDI